MVSVHTDDEICERTDGVKGARECMRWIDIVFRFRSQCDAYLFICIRRFQEISKRDLFKLHIYTV